MGYQHFKMDLTLSLFRGIEGCILSDSTNVVGNVLTNKGLQVWGEHVLNIRDLIGYKVKLGADHFGRIDAKSGIALGNFMADSQYSLAYIEDVVDFFLPDAVNLNQQITAGSQTPTLGFEDIFGFETFKSYIEQRTMAIIHPDPLTAGGMIESKKIAEYAALYGIPTMFHNAGSPVGTMGMVHCAATISSFISLENHFLEMPWWEDIVTVNGSKKNILEKGGMISVPDTPGLGIELNDEVIKEHMREASYLAYNPGFFEPTPMFDQPMSVREALLKGIIGDFKTAGPWWHINDEGVYANQNGQR